MVSCSEFRATARNVEPLIEDKLTEHSWPKFVHPYPLSEKHFHRLLQADARFLVGHLPGRRV